MIASSGTSRPNSSPQVGRATKECVSTPDVVLVFCAEHSDIAAMVTAGEYRIDKIVAVWRDEEGRLHVLPPCGRCREFIRQVSPANIDTTVVLDLDRSAPLSELLPAHDWPLPLDLG